MSQNSKNSQGKELPELHFIKKPEDCPELMQGDGADSYDITDHFQDGDYIFPLARFFGMWREGACAQKALPYVHTYVMAWPSGRDD